MYALRDFHRPGPEVGNIETMGLGRKIRYEGGIATQATSRRNKRASKPTIRGMEPKASHSGADIPVKT